MPSISDWIKEQVETLKVYESEGRSQVRMTVRLDAIDRLLLERIAEKLQMTKTACADQLLALAVRQAAVEFGMSRIEGAQLMRYETPEEAEAGERSVQE